MKRKLRQRNFCRSKIVLKHICVLIFQSMLDKNLIFGDTNTFRHRKKKILKFIDFINANLLQGNEIALLNCIFYRIPADSL